MSMFKAALLGLMIPTAFVAPALAEDGERPGPAMIFEQIDLDGDGSVTLEELQGAREARFAQADTNADGTLDRDELLSRAEARAAAGVDRMLERLDADGDGVLSQEEMAEARTGRGRGPNPERIFSRMDADGDGVVTQAEFDAAAERMMERRGHRHGDRDRG